MSDRPPRLEGVLETVLYFSDQARTERFYTEILGMRLMGKEPGRSLFFRAGSSVFLMFDAARALEGGTLPPHGATGPIHTCFLARDSEYAAWKSHLERHGVEVVREVDWGGARSFYFSDPDGNLLEVADRDIWPG